MATDKKLIVSGKIDKYGNVLLPMWEVSDFLGQFKGQRVVVTFRAFEPGPSAQQMGYYWAYVIPNIKAALLRKGERKTEQQVDEWLRREAGFLTEDGEMTVSRMSDYLEWLKQFAAENLEVFIEDPRAI